MKPLSKMSIFLILVCAIGIILFFPFSKEEKLEKFVYNGTAKALEFGRAGEVGYLTFYHNGSGKVELIALSEQPKNRIIVLKQDFLNTEYYPYFMEILRSLEKEKFSITEVEDIPESQNSIILLPCGAMPESVLTRIDNLTAENKIIYLGKKDLFFSENLIQFEWLQNVSNSSKPKLIILEKTLEEFYNEKNFSLLDDILRNSWAEENSKTFEYNGTGKKTVFIALKNASWLRMLPLSDSNELKKSEINISSASSLFPWEKPQIIIQLNYSNGSAFFSVEKHGEVIQKGELDRVRGQKAFFLTLNLPEPGDYLLRISDQDRTLGAKHIHIKDLNVSLSQAYGNRYEFTVLLDKEPLENASLRIGLNHSNNTVEREVKNGKFVVNANLKQGENVFLISIFNKTYSIFYINNQEDILIFYLKYLPLGLLLVGATYVIVRLNRKPVYKIRVPESSLTKNFEIKITAKDLVFAINRIEKSFGWKKTALYPKEIALGLKKFVGEMELSEGSVEVVLKKLEKKGIIKHYLGLYGLADWGDPKQNTMKRLVRDKLLQNGINFSEVPCGFFCKDVDILFDSKEAKREAIIVFEDSEKIQSHLLSLDEKTRAQTEIKIKNGLLKFVPINELDGFL